MDLKLVFDTILVRREYFSLPEEQPVPLKSNMPDKRECQHWTPPQGHLTWQESSCRDDGPAPQHAWTTTDDKWISHHIMHSNYPVQHVWYSEKRAAWGFPPHRPRPSAFPPFLFNTGLLRSHCRGGLLQLRCWKEAEKGGRVSCTSMKWRCVCGGGRQWEKSRGFH